MSQKATRKSQNATAVAEEKEKAETPVKEMKKKLAANAEKDKQAAEKADKPTDKSTEKNEVADKSKSAEKTDKADSKTDKNKSAEKPDKSDSKPDKNADKQDKNTDKNDKSTEKKSDKSEKVDKKSEKAADKKPDKSTEKKPEPEKEESKGDNSKEKGRAMNGHNGAANGDDANGTVSDSSDVELVIEDDEVFPELAYDDSDTDADDAPSRSLTRRSQVKATKTPETPAPRPASDRESDESKVLKLSETVAPSDRKLRSADSPKPEHKKKAHDSPKKLDTVQEEEKRASKKDLEATKKDEDGGADDKSDKIDVEVVVEVESSEGPGGRSRARVSPYSRSRLDRTATSVTADYTGNNSTMEMDITESSSILEDANDSGYLRGLRLVRGRASYKLLQDITLTHPRPRPAAPGAVLRPTGAVVGRKRKPSIETEAAQEAETALAAHGKRMRLLDRLAAPLRRSLPRRAAEIVGINTDLPLAAPVLGAPFDPEALKPAPPAPAPAEPLATPLPAPADRDGKRCVVM